VLNQYLSIPSCSPPWCVELAIVKSEPKVLTLKEILQDYIEYRVEVITRRTTYDLKKQKKDAYP